MDELLLISMTKLGADKLRSEWRDPASVTGSHRIKEAVPPAQAPACDGVVSNAALGFAALSLAFFFSVILGMAALHWYVLNKAAPHGEVYVTDIGSAEASVQVSQSESGTPPR
jgi:hypothetical protein